MNQNELIKEYKRLEEEHQIDFSKPSKHFKSAKEHYKNLQVGLASPLTFFDNTVALFNEVNKPKGKEDYKSSSGSRYWYRKDGVIRGSDHWGSRIVNCDWALKMKDGKTVYGPSSWSSRTFKEEKFGFCKWRDFTLKSTLLEINGKEVLTTFDNKIGLDIIIIDGIEYQKKVEVTWEKIGKHKKK